MAEKHKNPGNQAINRGGRESNIGNQQGTTQTGGQNSGGKNRRDTVDDEFSDDLRKSGNRNSSNTKRGS
jgi:hypothetical protein